MENNQKDKVLVPGFTETQVEIIRTQIAKGATDDELRFFLTTCNAYGLDPLKKEIFFQKQKVKTVYRRGQKGDFKDYPRMFDRGEGYENNRNIDIDALQYEVVNVTSRDGYRKIAQQKPNYKGTMSFAVHLNDEFSINFKDYTVEHKFNLQDRGHLVGAWAKVEFEGMNPTIKFVKFSEYNSKTFIWKQYPTSMIEKVAEVHAYRQAMDISGLTTAEELAAGENISISATINDFPESDEVEQPVIENLPSKELQEEVQSVAEGSAKSSSEEFAALQAKLEKPDVTKSTATTSDSTTPADIEKKTQQKDPAATSEPEKVPITAEDSTASDVEMIEFTVVAVAKKETTGDNSKPYLHVATKNHGFVYATEPDHIEYLLERHMNEGQGFVVKGQLDSSKGKAKFGMIEMTQVA